MKQRIGWLAGYKPDRDPAGLDTWFDARCKIKRTSAKGQRYNHCKVTCVDRKLLYVGSDNSYPNYNEEHGIWIEDQAAIESWRTTCFERRWSHKQAVDADLTSKAEVGKLST
jgi:phosphatidylserine/phosphatidylglycerophosphate/cardiolipin synthase-like enzyme